MARLRLLVHNPNHRSLAADLSSLAEAGLEVSGTASEQEAVARFQAGNYDILLFSLPPRSESGLPWTLALMRLDSQTVMVAPMPAARPLFAAGGRPDALRTALAEARSMLEKTQTGALAPFLAVAERIGAKGMGDDALQTVVEAVGNLTGTMAWLFIASRGEMALQPTSSAGPPPPVAVRMSRWATTEGKPLLFLEQGPAPPEWQVDLTQAGVSSGMAFPLRLGEAVAAAVCLLRRGPPLTTYDSQAASLFIPLMALALERQQVRQQHKERQSSYTDLQAQIERRQQEIRALNTLLQGQQAKAMEMEDRLHQMKSRYLLALRSLVNAMESGIPSQAGRSERGAHLMVSVAEALGLTTDGLAEAAYLHDLGTMLPVAAGGQATPRQHPLIAGQVVDALGLGKEVRLAVEHHHENYDGSGFPDGLAGDRIPLAARLLRVVDAYTELVAPTPPNQPLPAPEAVARVKAGVGREYDPRVVAALTQVIAGPSGKADTELISTVSHELRSPLQFLVGYSELLADEQDLPAAARERATEIHQEAMHMSEMVDDLLNVSRYEAGRVEVRRQETDLGQLVQRAVTKGRAKGTKHVIEVHLPAGPLTVSVDPDKVLRVLDNLVDNAIKYSPDGGKIVVSAEKGAQEVLVSVSDQGIGIPKEKQGLLFQKFSRIDSPLKSQVEGTGLGLNLCQHIVKAHGGNIRVESDAGRGSVFSFTIPLAG